MTTQAFNQDNDNILKKILATSELAKFESQILEATSGLSNERHSELIINLCNVIFRQHLTIKKQAEKIEDLQNKLDSKNIAIKTYQTMLFGSQSEKAKTLGQQEGSDDKINSDVPDTKENNQIGNTKDQSGKGEELSSSKKKNKRKYKKPPKRNKIPSKIPRVRIHHNAPCHCPSCGKAFKELKNMYAKSEELGIKVIFMQKSI